MRRLPGGAPPASRRRRQQGLVALVQVLGLAVWFSASAVVPAVRAEWGTGAAGAVWLTASVQVGFVVGALASAAANLPDRVAPQRLLAAGAAAAAACTVALALLADGLATAVPLRLATGVCLAAVYPVGMRLMASWSPPAERGLAFGVLIGALTLGSALPQLVHGLGDLPWRAVVLVAAALTAAGALVAAAAVRPGPLTAPVGVRPSPRYALRMWAERGPRLATLGYLGHMWELYALWTWLPTFLLAARPVGPDGAGREAGLLVFAAVGLAGVAGCLVGGLAADRWGRSPAAVAAMVTSGLCCLASPLVPALPEAATVVLLLVWGAAVIADSGVFSTALSETADPRYVGTALTAQTACGFLLTVVSIQLVPLLADAAGWRWALLLLAPGPLAGAVAMRALGMRRAVGATAP